MKITKCKKCGGNDFYIQETIIHAAALCPNEKNLTVYKERTCVIDRIFCKKCETNYSEDDFKQINFR